MADPERYATVAEVRAEGLSADPPTDAKIKEWLDKANQLVEKVTRNFFYEISGTVIFDGNNSHILHLPYPIRSVTSFKVNGSDEALDEAQYRAYIGNTPIADYRRNPKIELRYGTSSSIFTGTIGQSLKFLKGLDQTIEGTFGYLDPPIASAVTDRIPPVVKECVIAIVCSTAVDLYDRFGYQAVGPGGALIGTLKREKTDDHEIEFHEVDDSTLLEGNVFVPYIENRLRMFKAPMGVRVTSARWFEGGVQ